MTDLTQFARTVVAEKASADSGAIAPPANSDELADAVAEAQAEIAAAGEHPAMQREPYGRTLAGLSATLAVFPKMMLRMERAVSEARHPLSPDERAEHMREVVSAAKDGADAGAQRGAAKVVRRIDKAEVKRQASTIGGAFVLGSVLTLGAVFWGGLGQLSNQQIAGIRATLDGVQQMAFRDGPEGAGKWAALAAYNHIEEVIAGCKLTTVAGRRRCDNASLWLDPAMPAGTKQGK